ncbi:hypothetical protein AB0L64_27340 [Kribbella sp. NPDC051936]|uniref:hypothetical protein n=1 Tax=Kribbella sp. NPDC051936 TaxID=3154946 RepID=UPI003419CCDE
MLTDDRERGVAEHFDAALASLRSPRPRPTVTEAAEVLRQAAAADGAIWPQSSLLEIARTVVEPSWPLRHPLKFLRERATRDRGDSEQTIGSPIDVEHDAVESGQRQRVALDLTAYDAVKGVEFLAARPGEVGVVLNPWTQSVAEAVQRTCSPYRVYFIEDLPEGEADPSPNNIDT